MTAIILFVVLYFLGVWACCRISDAISRAEERRRGDHLRDRWR